LADQIESMGQTVIKGMDELRQAIGAVLEERVAFFEDQSAEKISAIQEKIFTALDTLKDTTESNAGELSYAIYNINQTLEMLKDHLSAQVDSVQTHLNKDIQAKISAVLDNNTNEIKGIFERLELLRKQSETTLITTIKAFSASVASFKEAQGANKGVLDELEKQIETTSELQENIQKLYYFLISQEDEIERMNDHIQSIANMSKQLQNLSDTLSRLPIQQN
jgi:molybdopterin converting factor small subunit